MGLRAVIFDVGNTLADYRAHHPSWEALDRIACRQAAEVIGLPADSLADAFCQALARGWRRAQAGQTNLTTRLLFLEALAALDLTLDEATLTQIDRSYCEAVRVYRQADPEAITTLVALKERGFLTAALSNTAWIDGLLARDLEELGIAQWLDCIAASAEIGHWKPQAQAFRWVAEQLGVDPAEAVYVGDRLVDDVGGAQGAGLRGVLRIVSADDLDYETGPSLGIVPDATIASLTDLLPIVDRWQSNANTMARLSSPTSKD